MSKNTNRKGLALGAMFSLVASLFGAAPASAAPSTTAFTFAPTKGSAYSVFVDHDFHMTVQRDASVVTATDFATLLKYEISTDRAHNGSTFSVIVAAGIATSSDTAVDAIQDAAIFRMSASAATATGLRDLSNSQRIYYAGAALQNTAHYSSNLVIGPLVSGTPAPTMSYVVVPGSRSATVTNFIGLSLGHYGGIHPSSESATTVVTVRAFLDLNGDNIFQAASEPSGTQAVTFKKYSAVARSVTMASLNAGETTARATATIAASELNLNQTDGKWSFRFSQWGPVGRISATSYSNIAASGGTAGIEQTYTFADGAGLAFTRSATIVSASASNSVSAQLMFFRSNTLGTAGLALSADGNSNEHYTDPTSMSQVILWTSYGSTTVAAAGASSFAHYAVKGDNVAGAAFAATNLREFTVRPNSTYTVRLSASGVVSGSAVTATFTFSNPALSATKYYSVNGGSAVTSGTASAVTATVDNETGLASITITTTGFATGDVISVSAKLASLAEVEIGLRAVALSYTLTADATDLAITPGGSVSVGAVAKDQFGVLSSALNQRIRFSWASGYNGTATISDVVLAAGRASATMVHAPATSTVAATVTAQLQDTVAGSNVWSNVGSAVTVNVTPTNAANGFRTGLAKSYSATISYGADFSWSPVINAAYVIVTGSSVVVSGTGLIFKDDVLGLTASDRITLPGDSNARVKFYVTARKAGTYTLTLTAGTATTTSLIVVADAFPENGSSMTFDVSSMESGRAAIVTGTLVDANGNPVDTTGGTAAIALSVTGTGATYVGSLTTDSNADGKFQVALLSGTNQTGTITITAVYSPTSGAAAADKVTKVHTVSVVAPTAPEVNAVIGSFNGRWAVRVENAKGSVVSVKAGNRWVKFSALNNNYLYSMKSVKGRTIAVSVWVDGELQNSQTITIK
jgi:hypothetical protein